MLVADIHLSSILADRVIAATRPMHPLVAPYAQNFFHGLLSLQCFDAVGWAAGRASGPKKYGRMVEVGTG